MKKTILPLLLLISGEICAQMQNIFTASGVSVPIHSVLGNDSSSITVETPQRQVYTISKANIKFSQMDISKLPLKPYGLGQSLQKSANSQIRGITIGTLSAIPILVGTAIGNPKAVLIGGIISSVGISIAGCFSLSSIYHLKRAGKLATAQPR